MRLLLATLALLAVSAPHAAAAPVDDAIAALRSDTVYVHSQADPTITPEQARQLRRKIGSNEHVKVAVLPPTGGDTVALVVQIGRTLDFPGAIAVVSGQSFRAGNSRRYDVKAGSIATQVFSAHDPAREGIYPLLDDWVARVLAAKPATSGASSTGSRSKTGAFVWLGIAALFGLGGFLVWSRTRTKQRASELRAVRSELAALDAELVAFEAGTSEQADLEYAKASERRDQAYADLASRDTALARTDIKHARRALVAAQALARGEQPPPEPAEHATAPNGQQAFYSPGGEYNGRRYEAGYYDRSNFWEGMFLGSMLSSTQMAHHHHDETAAQDQRASNEDDHGASDWDSGDVGGGDWGGNSGGDSGGGDAGGGDW